MSVIGQSQLILYSVAMTWRLGDHQKAGGARRRIADLMAAAGQDAHTCSSCQQRVPPVDFHHDFARKNVKELLRLLVIVAHFAGTRRNEFFDHA